MTRAYTEKHKLVITSTSDSIDGVGALTISSGGENSNVNLAPKGDGSVDVNSKKITRLAAPTADSDAATKAYVDATKQGLDVKDSVRVATTANITLSGTQTIDGVSVVAGDRVLVKNQTAGLENGIYVVAAGSWSRAIDANSDADVTSGMFTFVEEGTSGGDSGWVMTTNAPITLGTTALAFTQFSGAGQVSAGAGLSKTGNTLDVGGTADRITVGSDSVDIASTYVGQTSITTLGPVDLGTWQASTIGVSYGGTGATTASGAASNLGLGAEDSPSFAAVVLTATTVSSDTNSGAVVVAGGMGVAGMVHIGGGLDVNSSLNANSMRVTDLTASTSTTTGALVVDGGVGVGGAMNIGGAVDVNSSLNANSMRVTDVTPSTSTTTGALVVDGGVGVGGAMNIGGAVDVNSSLNANSMRVTDVTPSTSTTTGALVVDGGVGVGGAVYVEASVTAGTSVKAGDLEIGSGYISDPGNDLTITTGGMTTFDSNAVSSDTNSGAVVVAGGMGVAGMVHIGGGLDVNAAVTVNSMSVTDMTASTSTSTGALVVDGGLGVKGTMYATQANAGNIQVATNTIEATNANGSIYLAPLGTGSVDVSSKKITNLANPTGDSDAATKAYVDAVKQGLDIKDSVRVATTANITLSGTQTIDGVSVVAGDRVLVKNQTAGLENGIYVVAAGSWSRAIDANSDADVTTGMFCFVSEGTSGGDSGWVMTTNDPVTLGTTALAFTQFSGAGQVGAGAGLSKTGNTLDVGGTTDRITVNSDSVDIASTYVGQTSITTLGPVDLGTWQASTIGVSYGGTGATTASGARTNLSLPYTYGTGTSAVAPDFGSNSAAGNYSVVGGGSNNTASGVYSAVLAGKSNTASGLYSTILGGLSNTATHSNVFVLGSNITTTQADTTFVQSLSVKGGLNTGVTLAADAFPTGKISVRSAIVSLKNVADTTIFTVPTGYMFLIDTMEIVTTSVTAAGVAPTVQFGNSGDGDAYYGPTQVTSNSTGARHIIENPQDGVVAGTAVTFGVTTASTASAHSGVGIVTGYLVKTT